MLTGLTVILIAALVIVLVGWALTNGKLTDARAEAADLSKAWTDAIDGRKSDQANATEARKAYAADLEHAEACVVRAQNRADEYRTMFNRLEPEAQKKLEHASVGERFFLVSQTVLSQPMSIFCERDMKKARRTVVAKKKAPATKRKAARS